MAEDSPKCCAVNTIKGFGKVKKVCVYYGGPFITLFHDLPKSEDLIGTASSLPEPCLFFSVRRGSTVVVSLSKTTRLRTLYVTDSSIIPLQLLQLVRSPFLGSLIIRPVFHDKGASSDSHISRRMSVSNVAVICSSAFIRLVRKVDNAIHRINHYPVDSVVCFVNTHPLDSDLSGG